jgi:hypothetical protein
MEWYFHFAKDGKLKYVCMEVIGKEYERIKHIKNPTIPLCSPRKKEGE